MDSDALDSLLSAVDGLLALAPEPNSAPAGAPTSAPSAPAPVDVPSVSTPAAVPSAPTAVPSAPAAVPVVSAPVELAEPAPAEPAPADAPAVSARYGHVDVVVRDAPAPLPLATRDAHRVAKLRAGLNRSGALAVRRAPQLYTGYDAAEEERTYCRALLTREALAQVKAEVDEYGFWSVAEIRAFLEQNTTARRYTDDGVFVLDAQVVREIDVRTDQCVFILPDNTVMSRAELLDQYPFEEFGQEPEEIFAQQEVGVFPAHVSFMDQTAKDYLVRDYGDDFEFIMLEDEVGRLVKGDKHVAYRPAEAVVRTKVFLARDGWEDFMTAVKHVRSMKRLLGNLAQRGRDADGNLLLALLAPATRHGAGALALEHEDGIRERREAALRAREDELRRKEAELQRRAAAEAAAGAAREEELRKMEEELLFDLGAL